MTAAYDYATLALPPGRAPWEALAALVRADGIAAIRERGALLLGAFAPQIGFASTEAVLLVRWPDGTKAPPPELASRSFADIAGATHAKCERLAATVRPGPEDMLKTGGIYAHRWFTVKAADVDTFVTLSKTAWTGFEEIPGTRIFGLFTATRLPEEVAQGTARLLLLTWYADHGTWQRTRDPAPEVRALFMQRHGLTLTTVVRTSVLL